MFWKRCRCGGLPRLVELFIAAEGPSSAVHERRAQAWTFHFTFRSNCLSKTLRHDASFSVYCFIANTHSPATSSLKPRPCLGAAGTASAGPRSLTTFLHVTKRITKPDAQKNVNNLSATIQRASATAALFSFIASHQTLPNNANLLKTLLIDTVYSLKSPPHKFPNAPFSLWVEWAHRWKGRG